MSDKQIESLLNQINSIKFDAPQIQQVSYRIPGTPDQQFAHQRTNQQLVRSILYIGYLLRGNKERADKQDFLVDSLETVTSVMDNLYLLTKFGIGKQSKFLSNLSHHASKVWFITLLFTLKKLIGNIIRHTRLRATILKEIRKCQLNQNNEHLTAILIQKYESKMDDIKLEITHDVIELVGTLNDLLFVSIEIFNIKINPKLEKLIGYISAGMSLYRISSSRR